MVVDLAAVTCRDSCSFMQGGKYVEFVLCTRSHPRENNSGRINTKSHVSQGALHVILFQLFYLARLKRLKYKLASGHVIVVSLKALSEVLLVHLARVSRRLLLVRSGLGLVGGNAEKPNVSVSTTDASHLDDASYVGE